MNLFWLFGPGLIVALMRRSSSSEGSSVAGVVAEMPLPTLEAWTPVAGECRIGFSFPNGVYLESGERIEVGFDLSDAYRAAEMLLSDSTEIGRTSDDKLPPELARARQRFWWNTGPYPEHAKASLGYDGSKNPSDAKLDQWWSKIGKGGRKRLKVDWAAIQDHAPAGLSEKKQREWWSSIGKDKRGKFRDPYEHSLLEDVADAAPLAAELILPQALNLVVPGSGVAVAAGIQAAKLAAKAAKGKAAPAELVSAAFAAAGQPEPAQVLQAVKQVKAADAAKKNVKTKVAKAKALSTVASALKSPATVKALEKVGVPASQTARAANLFGAIKSAAAGLASEKTGDTARAAIYKRAAELQASAANVPAETVQAGAQKLYYLALTPGQS